MSVHAFPLTRIHDESLHDCPVVLEQVLSRYVWVMEGLDRMNRMRGSAGQRLERYAHDLNVVRSRIGSAVFAAAVAIEPLYPAVLPHNGAAPFAAQHATAYKDQQLRIAMRVSAG